MNEKSKIRYLKYSEIDFEKWNYAIDNADNALIYAHSCFLDTVFGKWSAYIYEDYEYVMPLPVKRKFGFRLLLQPLYCQQLGIFPSPPEPIMLEFIKTMKSDFKFVSINFNSKNELKNIDGVTEFDNYLLDIGRPYEIIAQTYSKHSARHIKKSYTQNFRFVEHVKGTLYIDFKAKNKDYGIYRKSIKILEKLLPEMQLRDSGKIYAVYDKYGEMCAAAVFAYGCGRIVYLSGTTTEKGKDNGAMYYLIDSVIRKNAGSSLLLDFEGSKIPGVARFFAGFGARPEKYYNLKYSKLPVFFA